MKRYPKYKDSGVKWIGEIPEHWEVKRLAMQFSENKTKNSDYEYQRACKFNYGRIVPKNEVGDVSELKETYIAYTKVKRNDIVINNLNLNYDFVSQRVAIVENDGIITSAYLTITPRKDVFASFYKWFFKAMDSKKLFHGMGTGIRLTLSYNELKKQQILVPPIEEQQAIVAYLDEKVGKIDRYISEKEKEIVALDELKQATIANAVTRGLDPNAPLKDSGIKWIGNIPQHWEVKRLASVSYEHYISNKEVHHQNLLSLSYGRIIRKDINKTDGLLPSSFDTYQIVEEGNIVLRLTDLQNDHRSLRVGLVKEEGIITSAYLTLGVRDNIIPQYLYYQLHSNDIHKVFYGMGDGIRQGLNWNGMRKLPMVLPPIKEQQAIVDYINTKTAKIDQMKDGIKSEIEKLKEYKQRLISDVVTGKVRVKGEK